MDATPDTTHPATAAAHLCEEARRAADRVAARARAAHGFGATAEAYRAGASELERQADRAAGLVFGQAAETFRAAAAESRLVATALDAIEGRRWASSSNRPQTCVTSPSRSGTRAGPAP